MADDRKTMFEKLVHMDRRWVFLVVAVSAIVPLFIRMDIPMRITPEVRKVYEAIDELEPGSVIMIPCEYAPDTRPELEPMLYSVLRHCYRKDIKVVVTCLFQTGVNLVEAELRAMAEENNREYGVDYVYLGYRPYPANVILSMGEDIRLTFPTDFYGTPLDKLPLMKGVKNYDDVELVMTINATGGTEWWIIYGRERYGFPLAVGVTAVMGADYYNYMKTGQIIGMLGGLRGAAEYEALIGQKEEATRGMNVQSWVHLVIVLFIVLGNIAFFATGRKS